MSRSQLTSPAIEAGVLLSKDREARKADLAERGEVYSRALQRIAAFQSADSPVVTYGEGVARKPVREFIGRVRGLVGRPRKAKVATSSYR